MNDSAHKQDLIVLVADLDIKVAIEAILHRTKSLGIREISFQVDIFSKHDSGCYRFPHDFLRPFVRQFDYAMVVFDRHGCGREQRSREELAADVESLLEQNGWAERAAAIVVDPELEAWVWSRSPEVSAVLGWRGTTLDLWNWLTERGVVNLGDRKPRDPKDALHKTLRNTGKRPSAVIFRELAQRVGLRRCTDPAFSKLKKTFLHWFSAE